MRILRCESGKCREDGKTERIHFTSRLIVLPAILLLIFSITSCEKVIDINLNEAEKKYVIEGVVTDMAGTARVKISQTKNFDENNSFPTVSGAIVSIKETPGVTYGLTETSPGIYESAMLSGTSGRDYTLTVNVGGQTFTAASKMPAKVNLDSIFITDEFIFTSTRKIANAVFDDPIGLGNSYRFVQYVNGIKENQTLIRNDDYSDGKLIVNKLFYFSDDDESKRNIKSGDNVMIDMLCIDPAIYKYWFSLDRSSIGGSGQATPSNPVTNLKGGALGYFSAQTLQTKTLVVP
ncbi:MAG: DUF4249 domain-containing protein [Chitinophagaceae bacterium]